MHASVALGSALSRDFKQLVIEDQKPGPRFSIKIREGKLEEAKKLLMPALIDSSARAAESFGHIDYRWYANGSSTTLPVKERKRWQRQAMRFCLGLSSNAALVAVRSCRRFLRKSISHSRTSRVNNKKGQWNHPTL